MLKEDGSFQQYGSEVAANIKREEDKNFPWRKRNSNRRVQDDELSSAASQKAQASSSTLLGGLMAEIQGTWDYLDGKLILAADRPPNADQLGAKVHDTLLVGEVVATYNESLADNPVLLNQKETKNQTPASAAAEVPTDAHLSVPQGNVEIGKFTYPKNHPSFFEQPMFEPTQTGSFQLRQVLGSLNTKNYKNDEDENLELFPRKLFYNKRFLLTSHPMKERKNKGRTRWSIKYNKFVQDEVPKSKEEQELEKNAPIPIRVMEMQLFANHTFCTLKGLGDDVILRGKWDVVGKQRNQLWMEVWRFGFGRSVSGSTYSEGRALSHNDAKTYWGEISFADETDSTNDTEEDSFAGEETSDEADPVERRLQVKGSVIYGWGLEPQPVARFLMTEAEEEEDDDDEEEDDDDSSELDWSQPFQ